MQWLRAATSQIDTPLAFWGGIGHLSPDEIRTPSTRTAKRSGDSREDCEDRARRKPTVAGIPDAAHDYLLGSRTALEWIIDRYQIKTDKASGIINDPNTWCDEQDDPTYIVELIKKITTVSVETAKLVAALAEASP